MDMQFIRNLIDDLCLTEKEREDITIEVPEASMERLRRAIMAEYKDSGLTIVADDKFIISDEIVPFDRLVTSQGTIHVKHSNKFAIYPTHNNKVYR